MERPRRLSKRGRKLLQKYVFEHYFEPLHVITARFNEYTKLHLSEWTIRRYIKELNTGPYIAVQKPFLRKKSMNTRVAWACQHTNWTTTQ